MKFKCVFTFILFNYCFLLYAQFQPPREFKNLDRGGLWVNCFFQDEFDRMWLGTFEGIYTCNNDVLEKQVVDPARGLHNSILFSSLKKNNEQFYIGTDNGLYLFNLRTDAYTYFPVTQPMDIRSMVLLDNDIVLLGTMQGLVQFNARTNKVRYMGETGKHPIYSLFSTNGKTVYISSFKGFYKLDLQSESYSFIPLPGDEGKSQLIISMAFDKKRNSIWIGTENDLFKYSIQREDFELKPFFSNNSFKTILPDSRGDIWLGTDNGLYIYNEEKNHQEYLVHSPRNNRSLVNNTIWSLFEDNNNTIWIGTDCGISLYQDNKNFRIYRWENITNSDEGNRMTVIYRDSRKNYWFGGTNGLVRSDFQKGAADWYKMRDSRYRISHNRIRTVYEDRDGNLWVGTDGSINRYDYAKQTFVQYTIMDSTRKYNVNWCGSVFEDDKGQLWISGFLGGLFVVNKQKLLAQTSGTYLAEKVYHANSHPQRLLSNRVQSAIPDKSGNVWVFTTEGLNKINANGGKVDYFSQAETHTRLSTGLITFLYCDAEGYIWVSGIGTLDRIDPRTNEVTSIHNELLNGKQIQSITGKGNYLWLILSEGIVVLDKATHAMQYLKMDGSHYSCSFLDPSDQRLWVGGIDQLAVFEPDSLLVVRNPGFPVVLTAIYVNDRLVQTGKAYGGAVISKTSPAYTDAIELNHHQNNLAIEFMGVEPNEYTQSTYCYRLEGVDKDWRILHSDVRRISYSNLQPGSYTLHIQQIGTEGLGDTPVRRLAITIRPPWYSSAWAKAVYCIFVLVLLGWIVNYFRVWNRLRFERLEKEKVLELSNLKLEFFTNMSHELKTPLSLILAPVNKLLSTTKNKQTKDLLQTIYQNATRLSTLLHRIIDFRDIDGGDTELSLSSLEIVEFVKSLIAIHRETFESKGISVECVSDIDQLYIQADPLKMESILMNLLSNACKFTRPGDRVTVGLKDLKEEEQPRFQLTVSDTGIGIPSRELPFIFDRFYQSEENVERNKEGSGIGLSMVKNYVLLHGGEISVTSEEKSGTSFVVTLPVSTSESPDWTAPNSSGDEILPDEPHLHILVVEDNVEIARFIADNLRGMRCIIAHNGKAGLEEALHTIPDLVIADIMMPVMDGIEMARLIRKNVSTSAIPVILLTAKNDMRTETDAYKLGVDAFIAKPFDMDYLTTRIRQLVQSRSVLAQKARKTKAMEIKEETVDSQDEKFLAAITRMIEENLQNPDLNVQKLAELSGYNAKQIYRRIKMLTGHTAVDYIKSIRLKKAAMLLSQKKFTVAEVMYMVGFTSHSYFSKCFSERYGKSPRVYMEESGLV